MPKRKKKKTTKSSKSRTPISNHTRQGSQLLPPFLAKIGRMSPSSWMNDRLPEMIWAALIRVDFGQDRALGLFRRILTFIGKHDKKAEFYDLTLTGISKLPPNLREELITFIVEPPQAGNALQSLRIFKALPAREVWDQVLPQSEPDVELLMNAVGATLWHQSQEATDCRWLRLMGWVISEKLHIPEEIAKEWFGYPNEGDQRKVRPSIRAAEITPASLEPPDLTWPKAFWDESWLHTPCLALRKSKVQPPIEVFVTKQRVREITEHLRGHWEQTHTTTAIDARHDGVFGMAFYCLNILDDLMGIGVGNSILGRLGLRTILEVRINIRFLINKNDEALWKKWRTYGAGQAKLNTLKFDETIEPPNHIDVESIEQIASEDIWEELLAINLAGWSGMDLRQISKQSQLKDTYDQYYSWTSGYAHGMWGPIRECCFRTCGNPLHRLHRYPETRSLPDVVEDAVLLVDEILADLDRVLPSFPHRLSPQEPRTEQDGAPNAVT